MPKRTNQFQQIIHILERQLAGGGRVAESRMLRERHSGMEREVDIVIEVDVGDRRVLIGVECQARSRPADVGWIEEMIGKHATLPTNKLVLVAKAGFTQQARTKAEALNVDVLTLAEAKVVDWTTIAGKQPHLSVATVTTIIVAASGVFAWDGPSGPLPGLDLETVVYTARGERQGTIADIAQSSVSKPEVALDIARSATEGENSYILTCDPPLRSFVRDEGDRLVEVMQLRFVLHVSVGEKIPIPLEHQAYGPTQVAVGTTDHIGHGAIVVVSEREGRPRELTVRVVVDEAGRVELSDGILSRVQERS